MKHILIVTQYFWPETFQINYVVKKLSKKNIKITVLTCLPNYPEGEIYEKYKNIKKLYFEKYENIDVYRCPVIPRKNASSLNLVKNYISFVYYGIKFFNKIKFKKKIDYILTYSTSPITSNLPAIFLKKKLNTKLAIWLQDIWPESIEATGHLNSKFLLNLINILVKYILNSADIILVPSKSFIKNTRNKTNQKVIYCPNSFYSTNYKNEINNYSKKILDSLKGRKNYIYSGNIGKAQNIELLVNAAEVLHNESNIQLVLIGNGSESEKVTELINKKKLKNIKKFNSIPYQDLEQISEKADGFLIMLKKHSLFDLYIPNKFQNYLKLKKPIIGCVSGEVKKIISENHIGFISKQDDYVDLANKILKASKLNSNELKRIKKNSQYLIDNYFSSNAQINNLLNAMDLHE